MSNLLSLCSFDYSEMREKAGGGGACLPWVFLGADAGLKFVTVAGHVLGQLVDDRLYVWGWGDDGGGRSRHFRCCCYQGDRGDQGYRRKRGYRRNRRGRRGQCGRRLGLCAG